MSLLDLQCRHRYSSGFELDLSFESDHMVTALFGPSGSGKTSLLSAIAGFLRPQSGKIELGGRTVLDTEAGIYLPPDRRNVGIVFQDHLLFPHLNVEANLRYGQRHRRQHRAVKLARVADVLEIGHLLKRYPRNLSGGERQRVALGRALLSGPELLIMDEPLASLDSELKAKILAYLERVVAEWEIPTLYVTHAQAEVRRLADWVVVIEQGRMVGTGTPDEALSQPRPLGWKNSVGPVNLLRLDQVQRQDEHVVGRIGDQLVHLPLADMPDVSPLFVQFSPGDVTLSRRDVSGVSARNHLQGQIRQVISLDQGVFVAVDIGQVVWAEVTRDAAVELDVESGGQVMCLLKVHSLSVLS